MLNINTDSMGLKEAMNIIGMLQEVIERDYNEGTKDNSYMNVDLHLALSVALAAMNYMQECLDEQGDDFSLQYEYSEDVE